MQLVRPKVVAMAVRMEIIMLMISFQVSFLFSVDIIIKVLGAASPSFPSPRERGVECSAGVMAAALLVDAGGVLKHITPLSPWRGGGGEAFYGLTDLPSGSVSVPVPVTISDGTASRLGS